MADYQLLTFLIRLFILRFIVALSVVAMSLTYRGKEATLITSPRPTHQPAQPRKPSIPPFAALTIDPLHHKGSRIQNMPYRNKTQHRMNNTLDTSRQALPNAAPTAEIRLWFVTQLKHTLAL